MRVDAEESAVRCRHEIADQLLAVLGIGPGKGIVQWARKVRLAIIWLGAFECKLTRTRDGG